MSDTLKIFGKTFTDVEGFKAKDQYDNTLTYTRGGGGSAIKVTTTQLPGGGEHKTITAVDLSNDTVVSPALLDGYTAHDSDGNAITGVFKALTFDNFLNNTEPAQNQFYSTTATTATTVPNYKFYGNPNITSVSGNSITEVKPYAFYNCANLQEVNFPNVEIVGDNAFYNNGNLETFDFSKITTDIGSSAFSKCKKLENLSFDSLVTMAGGKQYAFNQCKGLKKVVFPELTTMGGTVNYWMFYRIGDNTESGRKAIIVMPKIQTIGKTTFDRIFCDTIDLGPGLSYIPYDCFYSDVEAMTVKTLILRRTQSAVTAYSTGAIKGLRDVYVPSALISTYQQTTNWKARIDAGYVTLHAIEGSAYDGYWADGTPIT